MNVKYAITRLKQKFSRNTVTVDGIDREAINEIIDFYNFSQERTMKENKLFHKLFMYTFLNRVIINGDSTEMALSNIETVLKQPLSQYQKSLVDNASYFKTKKLLEGLGFNDELPVNLTESDIEENEKIINDNREFILKSLFGGFSAEKAMTFIEDNVGEMILKYRNND